MRMIFIVLVLLVCPGWSRGVQPFVGEVATRASVPDTFDATKTQMMSRSGHFARNDIKSLQIVLANFASTSPTFSEEAPGNSATVTASIEYPAGSCHQVTFSSSSTGSVPNAGSLVSDALTVIIPNGSKFWVRIYQTSAGGVVYNAFLNGTQFVAGNPMGDAVHLGTSGISDQTTTCDTITDNSDGGFHPPFAIIAKLSLPALCLLGDSETEGADSGPDSNGNSGAIMRSLGPSFSYINLSVDGTSAAVFNTNANAIEAAFQWCSHLNVEFVNDIANGASLPTIEASLSTIYSTFTNYTKNSASATIFQNTAPPRTTSTDSWATLANQSTQSFESVRVSFNTALRNATFGPNGGYFDFDQPLESSLNSGKWNAGGGFPACTSGSGNATDWTTDGVHPASCGSNVVASSGVFVLSRIHYP